VPLQTVALEPEQQVGSAAVATGLPCERPCSNATNSARPRGKDLGSKGFQVGIEHCRRRHIGFPAQVASEIQLLRPAQHALDAIGNYFQTAAQVTFKQPVAGLSV